METLHNTCPSRNKSNISNRVRSILTIAGIVTAIICSLILLKDIHAASPAVESLSGSIQIADFVNTDLLVTAKSIASALPVFK